MAEPIILDHAGLIDVYETLKNLGGTLNEPMHRYRAVAMRRQIQSVVEGLIEVRDKVKDLEPKGYNDERIALCQKYVQRDAKNQPVLQQGQFYIPPEVRPEFDSQIQALMEKHKASLDAYQDGVKKTNEWLKEDITVPEIKERLKLSWFNSSVRQEWLETLFPWIEDDTALAHKPAEADVAKADKKDKQKG
jgi:hypothetical protein